MTEMTFTNEYFSQKIFELRAALREMDSFEPVKGISENIKADDKKINNKSRKPLNRKQQRVNTK